MKMIIETKHEVYTAEFKNSDVGMGQIIDSLRGMLLSYGFDIETINEYLKTDDEV
jgi:hypothetical protein